MGLRNAREVIFYPVGLTDGFEQTFTFKGACQKLYNLIQDQNNNGLMVARPGVTTLVDLAQSGPWTAATPGIISVFSVIGSRIYGMIAVASGTYAGKDVPFIYDTASSAFTTISGIQALNLPTSITYTNPVSQITPPTIAQVGTQVLFTHPGFDGNTANNRFFGVLDMSAGGPIAFTGTVSAPSTLTGVTPNPITSGVRPGWTISDGAVHVPANSYVVSMTANTITINATLIGGGAVTANATGGTFNAPLWGCANINLTPCPTVPVGVAQYNNRAWFAVGNAIIFSDILNATNASTAVTQVLTLGDAAPLTALAGLPLQTGTQGVLAALVAFKGAGSSVWQITGDVANSPSNLSLQNLANTSGCWAPRTIAQTPNGIYYLGIDSVYVVNLLGQIYPLANKIGDPRSDIADAFTNATQAQGSNACAAWNQGVYRISLESTWRGYVYRGVNSLDYWFDEHGRRWTGTHSWPYHCAAALQDAFVLSSYWAPAKLCVSFPDQHNTSVYTDIVQSDGLTTTSGFYNCEMTSALMPNIGDMAMNAIVETTVEVGHSVRPSQYLLSAQDDKGNTLNTATINLTQSGSTWAASGPPIWGSFVWGSGAYVSGQYSVGWSAPIIFKRLAIDIIAPASQAVAMGEVAMRYQKLNYTLAAVS